MTPEQIQSEVDCLFAEAQRLMSDGERRAASTLLGVMRRLKGYLPDAPPEPVMEPPTAPVEATEPIAAPVEPEQSPPPQRRFRKPKGL